ncbi:MAG: dihydroneopterin aldolase [Bacteroidota bacterium]
MPIISLERMEFFAHHGVYEYEKERGNTFEADVWLDLGDMRLPEQDQLHEAVDYSQIFDAVNHVMQERVNLLETLVARIGKELEVRIPEWVSARVRVSKMSPPVQGICERSSVEATFYRN